MIFKRLRKLNSLEMLKFRFKSKLRKFEKKFFGLVSKNSTFGV